MRSSLLLVAALGLGSAAHAAGPVTTCDQAWLARYGTQTTHVAHVQVTDANLVLGEVRTFIEDNGGIVTRRNRNNNQTFDLHANLPLKVDLVAVLEPHEPVWQHEQETRTRHNVAQQCAQLTAARRVSSRLEAWMSEAGTPEEKQYLVTMYQNHLRQVQNLDNQMRNIETQRPPHTIQLRVIEVKKTR